MTTIKVSEKGQVTLPAELRRELGFSPRSRLEVEVRDGEMILRRVRTAEELYGIFAEYAIPGMTHEKERELMMQAVTKEANGE